MYSELPFLQAVPVLENVYALPCPQGKPAVLKWNGKLGLGQGCLYMRRHIIRSLAGMPVRTIPWSEAGKIILQITAYIGIGVFLDGERGGGMTYK